MNGLSKIGLFFLMFFVGAYLFTSEYSLPAQIAGEYCGTLVGRGDPYEISNAHDTIQLVNFDWYCADYIKECKYGSCKVTGIVLKEKVPWDYINWKKETR